MFHTSSSALVGDALASPLSDTRLDSRAPRLARDPDVAAQPVAAPVSRQIIAGLVRFADFALVALAGIGLFVWHVAASEPGLAAAYGAVSLLAAAMTVGLFQALGLYAMPTLRDAVSQGGRIVAGWSVVIAALIAMAFLAKLGDTFSRGWLTVWYVSGLIGLFAWRGAVTWQLGQLARAGRLQRRAVIVGGGAAAESLIQALRASGESDVRICGVFDDRSGARSPDMVAGCPKLGSVAELVDFGRKSRIDLLIVALPISAERRLLEMLRTLWVLPVDIRLAAHANGLRLRPRAYSYIGNVPMLDVFDKPITDWDYLIKAAFDRVVGVVLLIAAAPLMAATALAIKLDSPGPVFFKQKRYGFNNELIEVYKFRSLYVNQGDLAAAKLVTKDDPRVTRVGRFIRKTSIDELPQLINVLRGTLSLVGPRPHAMQAKADNRLYDDVVDGYFARHRVKPGITGWAQVNGWRGETDTEEKIQRRVDHDLYYIENWSILLDLYILVRTPISLMSKTEAAY